MDEIEISKAVGKEPEWVRRQLKGLECNPPWNDLDVIRLLMVDELERIGFSMGSAARLLRDFETEFVFLANLQCDVCWLVVLPDDTATSAFNHRRVTALLEGHPGAVALPLHVLFDRARTRSFEDHGQ